APRTDAQCSEPFQVLVRDAVLDDACGAEILAPVRAEPFESIDQQPMVAAIGHRMDDDPAFEPERLEHALHVLEGGVRRLIIGVLLRRVFFRVAVDMELAIATLRRRKRDWRARVALPLREGLLALDHLLLIS